jgi:hypothetical protein
MTTRAGRPQCKRKLMNEQVRIIRELRRQGHTHRDVAPSLALTLRRV